MSAIEPSFKELDERRRRVGLSYADLARIADVHHDTAFRAFSKGDHVLRRTKTALIQALETYEVELRNYLLELHPLPDAADPPPSRSGTVAPLRQFSAERGVQAA